MRRVELVTGTAVELGTGQITARVAAELHSDDAEPLTLEADAADSWTIDSVETNPAESLADWSLENRPGGRKKLLIRLSKAPAPKQTLRLAINCRRLPTFHARQLSAGICFLCGLPVPWRPGVWRPSKRPIFTN